MSTIKNVSKKVNNFEKNSLEMGYFERKHVNKSLKGFGHDVAVTTVSNVTTDVIENLAYAVGKTVASGTMLVIYKAKDGITALKEKVPAKTSAKKGAKTTKPASSILDEAINLIDDELDNICPDGVKEKANA